MQATVVSMQSYQGCPHLCSFSCLPAGPPLSSPALSSPTHSTLKGSCSIKEQDSHVGSERPHFCLPPAPGAGSTAPFHYGYVTVSCRGALGLWVCRETAGGRASPRSFPLQSSQGMESQSPRLSNPHAGSLGWPAAAHLFQDFVGAGPHLLGT